MAVTDIREYRVWCESGDYLGGAKVTTGGHESGGEGFLLWPDPYSCADSSEPSWYGYEHEAMTAARELAESYMAEAIEDETKRRGEVPTGIMSDHGFSIQVCEGDYDMTGHVDF